MDQIQPFTIADEDIAPGTTRDLAFPITTMATGTASSLAVRVLHGARPGPAVFVSAAIHGDEIVGTAVIQRLAQEINPQSLAGTLLLVPVANIFGFITHSRYLPDRRDLNRSFPGSAGGSLAGQLANIFYREVVGRCELGIDIHTAGRLYAAMEERLVEHLASELAGSGVGASADGQEMMQAWRRTQKLRTKSARNRHLADLCLRHRAVADRVDLIFQLCFRDQARDGASRRMVRPQGSLP
jgi:hypothetical protein